MRPVLGALAVWLAVSALMLLPLIWFEAHGFLSNAVIESWAKAIVQIDGPPAFRATEAFYPPLPSAIELLIQLFAGGTAVPVPHLLAAGAAAVLALSWYRNFVERGGYAPLSAALLVVLLVLNPAFLRALAEGPGMMFLILGVWIYCRGLVDLRLSGAAPDMIKVAVGLLIIPMSHEYGLLVAAGALPFIVVAARPSMLVASATGYVAAMFFPVVAAVGSLMFVGVILKTPFFSGWFRAPAGTGPDWMPLTALAALLIPVLAASAQHLIRARYALPLLAMAGTLAGAAALNVFVTIETDPVLVAVPCLSTVAAAVLWWPPSRLRAPVVAALLAAIAPAFLLSIARQGGAESRAWLAAAAGTPVENPVSAAGEVAAFLRGRSGVIVDVERNPDLVAALGTADNLVMSGQPGYELALLGGRPVGGYIAVRRTRPGTNAADRLLRAMPALASGGTPHLPLVYDRGKWRVFQIQLKDEIRGP